MQRLLLLILISFVLTGCFGMQETAPAGKDNPNPATRPASASRFIVAGSGTNLPITEKLADAYRKKTGSNIEVPKSIGSDGAIRAVQDGSISLGLLSRPLTEAEQATGLNTIQYARVGIVFAVHPSVSETNITDDDILRIHRAEKTTWPDNGKIRVLIRNIHDSSNQILFAMIPGFRQVIEESLAAKRWPIMYHDVEMSDALRTKVGSFGHTDTTSVKIFGGIKPLSLNGIVSSPENIQTGRYPWVKELSFLYKGKLAGQAEKFVEFVHSPEGCSIIEAYGGVAIK